MSQVLKSLYEAVIACISRFRKVKRRSPSSIRYTNATRNTDPRIKQGAARTNRDPGIR